MHKFLLFCLTLLTVSNSFAQHSDELFKMYQEKNIEQLIKMIAVNKSELSSAEQSFYNTLFIKDAEKAFTIYEDLFKKTDGRIKYLCAERLKDYYYAQGYYSTASDYEKYLFENRNLIENIDSEIIPENNALQNNIDEEKLYIQVGAFGLQDNAKQMKSMLDTQKIEAQIVTRKVNNNSLFCVWVTGDNDFNSTLKFAEELKEKYHLDYKIIKK